MYFIQKTNPMSELGINEEFIIRESDNAFIPNDDNNKDYQEYLEWVKEGNIAKLKPVSLEEMKIQYINAVQFYMDSFAKTRGYDNILSVCSYATSTNEKFKIEGQYCVEMRDLIWYKCNIILNEVLEEKREIPSIDTLLLELPKLEWPI